MKILFLSVAFLMVALVIASHYHPGNIIYEILLFCVSIINALLYVKQKNK